MKDRRDFLKSSLILGAVATTTPKILLASNDYSLKNNPDQKKYIYNPFAPPKQEKNTQTSRIITRNANENNLKIKNEILPNQKTSNSDFWDRPRMIRLLRTQTGENANIVYFENGQINEQGYQLACYLLRDVRQNETINMDLRLLDLICAVQAWLVYFGYTGPLRVTSGYRSKKTNSSLENAAKNSMHLYGKAIDFKVPGLTSAQIANIAKQFQAGGIGIYPNQNFIHLDTGGVRLWVGK